MCSYTLTLSGEVQWYFKQTHALHNSANTNELHCIVLKRELYVIHCDTVYRPQGFVTCFLASSLWLVDRTTGAGAFQSRLQVPLSPGEYCI